MASEDVVLTRDDGPVRIVTLNRPRARNALSGALVVALYEVLIEADTDDAVRVVVLTGTDPAFCAGVDLKEAAERKEEYFALYDETNCIAQVALMRTPVIGAVNGATFTGGLEIALGCDMLIASEHAVFADTHARVGVLPGGGMTARLPHLVGQANARRMSMTGELVDAGRAERIGLVTEVVAHDALMRRTLEVAHSITEVPATVMGALKQMYVQSWNDAFGPALDSEHEIARAGSSSLDELDQRRRRVQERNRAQLADRGPAAGSHPRAGE